MPAECLPTYLIDFAPGLTAPTGYARRQAQHPRTGVVVEDHVGYRVNDHLLTRAVGAILPPSLADALDSALAAYLADRVTPRSVDGSRQWHRDITLRIPVRQPLLWTDDRYRKELEAFLSFLTDDRWSVEFVPRIARPRRSEQEAALFRRLGGPASVAVLHSGGLDSCLGIIAAARAFPGGAILAVSAVSHSHPSAVQQRVLRPLRRALPAEIVGASLRMGLRGIRRSEQESSQRARGFLYLMVGAVAALLADAPRLQVSETGIGAINLPCTPDQIGTHTTRAMHPLTIARFDGLLALLLGQRLPVSNVGIWSTKAEQCREMLGTINAGRDDVLTAIQSTVSCDRFPWVGMRHACGSCTSCLFRRLSLHAAGLAVVDASGPRQYAFDPLSSETDWNSHDLVPLYALRLQVAQLENAIRAPQPYQALIQTFPSLTRLYQATAHLGLSDRDLEQRVIRLFQTYVAEWHAFEDVVHWPAIPEQQPIVSIERSVLAAVAS